MTDPPSGPNQTPAPSVDTPSAADLVVAVREFLERDVLPATTGRVSFHARVAVNVLATVERELALAPELVSRHRQRLAQLGFGSDAELAAAIRAGDVDGRWDEVAHAVRASVVDKLRVANPGYLDQP